MSYEKRVKKRKKRKISNIILFVIIVYIILTSFITLFKRNAKTVLPERMVVTDSILSQGIIIKNETLIKSQNNGVIDLTADEGQRLAAGQEVATINTSKEMKTLEYELIEIEKNISSLEETEGELIVTEEHGGGIKEELILKLQNKILSNDFSNIALIKDQLILYDESYQDEDFSETLIGQSIDNLKDRKESITKELNQNYVKYYTSNPGVISYEIDGYEEKYLPENFQDYTYDKLNIDKPLNLVKNEEDKILENEPIFKVIDNFQWYMCIKIEDNKEIEDFEVNDNIRIHIDGDEKEIKGNIMAINTSKKKSVIVAKFNTMFHDYYKMRFPEVEIIKDRIDGYKIPKKAMVTLNNINGVYIKDRGGIVRFKPISIFKEGDDHIYIYSGDENTNIYLDNEDEPLKTISLFDEIIIKTSGIKEGDIL